MIVVDTNLIAYLLIPGSKTKAAEQVLRKDPHWAAPLLWRSEFRNVLAVYMRRQGMSLPQAVETMEEAEHLLSDREYALPSERVLGLTAETGLSAYDAEFVLLAEHLGIKLVTTDAKILREAPRWAVAPEHFIKK